MMKKRTYWILIILPSVVVGLVSFFMHESAAVRFVPKALIYVMAFYIPAISFLRMRYLKFTWKEMLLFFLPFTEARKRFYRED